MKVIYKRDMLEKILEAKECAAEAQCQISKIELNETESLILRRELNPLLGYGLPAQEPFTGENILGERVFTVKDSD
jgi:hypothetical protein|tara:strand:- start:4128 stop:4355 length:228 start_codon:yes stop_codon:yes gene_type:complete